MCRKLCDRAIKDLARDVAAEIRRDHGSDKDYDDVKDELGSYLEWVYRELDEAIQEELTY